MLKDKASLTTESVELRAALMKAKERTDIERGKMKNKNKDL